MGAPICRAVRWRSQPITGRAVCCWPARQKRGALGDNAADEPTGLSGCSASPAQPLRRRSSLRQGPAATRRQINRLAKMAAIVSLPVSIALVYAGHKRWHAITGWGFVGALATHMYIHRKNTFR